MGIAVKVALPAWFWVVRGRIARAVIFALVLLILLLPSLSFLVQAVSPKLFGQGSSWFTFANISQALSFGLSKALFDSVWVSLLAALMGSAIATILAFIAERTKTMGRRFFVVNLWAILLAPTYLVAVGWEQIVDRSGLLSAFGIWSPAFQHLIMGPFGVSLILAFKGVPFAYFAIAPSLSIVGGDLEHAVRVHGGSRFDVFRTVGPVLLPALLSGFIVVFAESIGDFGVATTIAASSHFPIATYFLYQAIGSFPANFGEAAVVGWALVIAVGGALLLQSFLLRGRNFAVLSGRTKPAPPRELTWKGQLVGLSFSGVFFLFALGVPIVGVISSSLLIPFVGLHWSSFTFANYSGLLGVKGLEGPIRFSAEIGLVCGALIVVLGAVLARTLASRTKSLLTKLLDLTLLSAVALPGVVFAAGYIFAYNLPILTKFGVVLYGTVPLLGVAYVANSVPQSTRILLGPFSQIQETLLAAARVHGASSLKAWRKGVLPLLARPIVWAGLLAFSAVFLELPISELLAPPGVVPVSVAILRVLGKADIGLGTALSVVAVLFTLLVVAGVLGIFRLFAPVGWRKWHKAEERLAEAKSYLAADESLSWVAEKENDAPLIVIP